MQAEPGQQAERRPAIGDQVAHVGAHRPLDAHAVGRAGHVIAGERPALRLGCEPPSGRRGQRQVGQRQGAAAMRRISELGVGEPPDDVGKPVLALRLGRERDAATDVHAIDVADVGVLRRLRRGRELHLGHPTLHVGHVPATEVSRVVSDRVPTRRSRCEQQAGGLQAAAGQNVTATAHVHVPAVQAANDEAGHTRALGVADDLGADDARHQAGMARLAQAVPVLAAEVRGQRPALELGGAHVGIGQARQQRPTAQSRHRIGVEHRTAAAQPVARALKVRANRVVSDRPACVGDVVPRLEVDRVERHATSAPDRRRPAHLAPGGDRRRRMHEWIDEHRLPEALSTRVGSPASALEQEDVDAGIGELQGRDDAGRPRPHDHDVCGQRRAVGQVQAVDDHRPALAPGAATRDATSATNAST